MDDLRLFNGLTGAIKFAPLTLILLLVLSTGVPDAYDCLSEFEIRERAPGSNGTFIKRCLAEGLGDML